MHDEKKTVKHIILSILTFLFFLVSYDASAQEYNLRFDQLTSENGLPQNTIHGIVKDKYGFMWFGTWSGLCRYDGYKFKIYRSNPYDSSSISNNRIHNLYKDYNQDIWVQTFDTTSICRYNYLSDDFDRIPVDEVPQKIKNVINRADRILTASYSTNNYKWNIDNYTGSLTQTHLTTGKQSTYPSNPSNRWSLNEDVVADLYLDDHNILWVGTYSNGINKAIVDFKPFKYYHHDERSRNSLHDNNIRAICEDKSGNLWIGSRDKGITMMDRENNKYVHFQQSDQIQNSLSNDRIRKIYCESLGQVWIGTKRGLDRFDPATQTFHHYALPGVPNASVYYIMEDRLNNLWIGTWRGIYKYDREKDSFIGYDPEATLKRRYVRTILEDKNDHFWVGTEGGGVSLLERKPYGEKEEELQPIHHFVNNPADPHSLSDDRIYCLLEDKEGYLWVGTGNGLNRYDPKKNSFDRFSIEEGLADPMIMGMLQDEKGYLWLSHKRGLSRLNTQTLTILNYSMQDGLQSNEFSEDTFFKSKRTGEMFFGGNNGFNSFFPDSIHKEESLPQIVFTDLQVLNQPVKINQEVNGNIILSKPLHLSPEISLSHQDQSIAIEFAALHYHNPQGNKYAYMLEGFDKDWIYTDASRRIASYSNLEPKDYVLKVRASNSDGIWNPVPATLSITVLPPFWKTPLAYFLYVIIVVLLLYLFYAYSLRMVKLKNKLMYESLIREKESDLHQQKLQFFTNISHELRTPLSLITDPIKQLETKELPFGKRVLYFSIIKRNLEQLTLLINQILNFRKTELKKLQPNYAINDGVKIILECAGSFEALAVSRSINLGLEIEKTSVIGYFDKTMMVEIIQNLVSNAFKYTPEGGQICIKVAYNEAEQELILSIIDSGIGIKSTALDKIFEPFNSEGAQPLMGVSSGMGLALTRNYVELLGGKIQIFSEQNKGTTARVKLPVRPIDPPLPFETVEAEKVKDRTDKPSILMVEDNKDLQDYLSLELGEEYDLTIENNGVEGLKNAVNNIPDLIISDVMMPEMDGVTLCGEIKKNETTSHIPVILLTAKTGDVDKIKGLQYGADVYFTKPFSVEVLKAQIVSIIENRLKQQKKYAGITQLADLEKEDVHMDNEFLKKAIEIVNENISEAGFNADVMAQSLNLSERQLYRKMKAVTGSTVMDFINRVKMEKAAELLIQNDMNISEVAYQVGFLEPSSFSRKFSKHHGCSPKKYMDKNTNR